MMLAATPLPFWLTLPTGILLLALGVLSLVVGVRSAREERSLGGVPDPGGASFTARRFGDAVILLALTALCFVSAFGGFR